MNVLGKRIKNLRESKNLNQREFAKILNISNSTLSQYETGQRVPSDEVKICIANYFGVSIDYLLGNSDIRDPYKDDQGKHPLPDSFETPEEAMEFILKQKSIMAYGGFDAEKLTDEQKLDFANELLEHLKLLSYKYKK